MKSILTSIVQIFISLLCIATPAWGNNYILDLNLQLAQGLPNNSITSIIEDSQGYLWIGTFDGLARYNGTTITTFSNSLTKNIFRSNHIRSIYESKNGDIWVGTDRGVTIYDCKRGDFRDIDFNNDGKQSNRPCVVRRISASEGGDHIYCVTESNGLLIYDQQGELVQILATVPNDTFHDIIHIQDTHYILVANHGLFSFNTQNNTIKRLHTTSGNSYNFGALTRLDGSSLLYGTNSGIYKCKYSIESDQLKLKISNELLYKGCVVHTLNIDDSRHLWVGTDGQGVYHLPNVDEQLGKPLIQLSTNSRISALLNDRYESQWVATFDKGLFHYKQEENFFKTLDTSHIKDIIQTIAVVAYDDDRIIYQYAYDKIKCFNIHNGKECALPAILAGVNLSGVRYIHERKDGEIWLFLQPVRYGVRNISKRVIIDAKREKIRVVDDPKMIIEAFISPYKITEDDNGDLWLGFLSNLYKISIGKGDAIDKVESINQHRDFKRWPLRGIRALYFDEETKSLWVAGNLNGVYRLYSTYGEPIEEAKVEHYTTKNSTGLSSDFVTAVLRSSDNTLYLGTEQGGLCIADESQPQQIKFRAYGTESGLSNNSVKSIVEDHDGTIWISTNYGVTQYDPSRKRFVIYKGEQWMDTYEFQHSAITIGDEIVFTTSNNLCHFNPDKLPKSAPLPNVQFTHFKLFNQLVEPNQLYNDRVVLTHTLSSGDCIGLNHNENMITIGIDVLEPKQFAKRNTLYRLMPISEDWIALNSDEISLRGLSSGNYTLEVKAMNFFGEYSDVSSLQINIEPPFWRSKQASIIYFLLFCAAILLLIKIMRLRYKMKLEQINTKNREVMNAEKLRYFSNVSHELKTPLTLIMAPVTLLKERFIMDSDVRQKLDIIRRQSNKMLHLIELAHGIQLNDSDLLQRCDSQFSFNDFLSDILSDFELMATYEHKQLILNTPQCDILVKADADMIEKVVNNLLSNAFKHTKRDNTITIGYEYKERELLITVSDTGFGIAKDHQALIFDRFYRAPDRGNANVGGTGIGLYFSKTLVELHRGNIGVESEINVGTTFSVTLPIVVETKEIEVIDKPAPVAATATATATDMVIGELSQTKIKVSEEFRNSMVYIVEDNADMRQFIVSIVSQYFHTKEFANGEECCEALKEEWPDIVISDVMMPVMDGYELCETMKGDIKTSHIPIILLTACASIDDKIKGLEYGADAYIAKPFHPDHIITRIEALLNSRKQLRERYALNIPIVYSASSTTRAKDNDFLDRLYQIFSENLENDEFDSDAMVEVFGVNRNQFFQKVKAITNTTPHDLLKEYRLQRATEMLQSGTMNVSEVCMMTGFKNRTHFSKVFKEKFGVSPSKYSQQIYDVEESDQ